MQLKFSSKDYRKILKYKVSRKSVKLDVSCSLRTERLTDGQADMKKPTVAFQNFSKAPQNYGGAKIILNDKHD